MSERVFRLITGMVLWAILLFSTIYQNNLLMIAFCALLIFEGVTNWRVPTIISKIRFGSGNVHNHVEPELNSGLNIEQRTHRHFGNIEAERMMRFMVVLFLFISFFTFPEILWFFPWYIAGMMIVAGISNICPMVMFLRWMGFK